MKFKNLLISFLALFLVTPNSIKYINIERQNANKGISIGVIGDGNSGSVGVTSVKPTSISIPTSLTMNVDDDSYNINVTYLPANTSSKYKNVSWSSSDSTVASVDTSGKITPLKVGTTTITATCDVLKSYTLVSKCNVTITKNDFSFDITYMYSNDHEDYLNATDTLTKNNLLQSQKKLSSSLCTYYRDSFQLIYTSNSSETGEHNYNVISNNLAIALVEENDYGAQLSTWEKGYTRLRIIDSVNNTIRLYYVDVYCYEKETQTDVAFCGLGLYTQDGIDEFTYKYSYYCDYNKITDIDYEMFTGRINNEGESVDLTVLSGMGLTYNGYGRYIDFGTQKYLTPELQRSIASMTASSTDSMAYTTYDSNSVNGYTYDYDIWNFIPNESKTYELSISGKFQDKNNVDYIPDENVYKLNVSVFKTIENDGNETYEKVMSNYIDCINGEFFGNLGFYAEANTRYVIQITERHILENENTLYYINIEYKFTLD